MKEYEGYEITELQAIEQLMELDGGIDASSKSVLLITPPSNSEFASERAAIKTLIFWPISLSPLSKTMSENAAPSGMIMSASGLFACLSEIYLMNNNVRI